MDKEQIFEEINNWENEEYLRRVADELNSYSKRIDGIGHMEKKSGLENYLKY